MALDADGAMAEVDSAGTDVAAAVVVAFAAMHAGDRAVVTDQPLEPGAREIVAMTAADLAETGGIAVASAVVMTATAARVQNLRRPCRD
jgi:hypothetical protein